ncbi:hypothetical protein [Lagierella sp.]|uniref:hypothetical protein n=1 Tax=Lagierella sp. TaxID=2849657 RepID=UPI00261AE73F|nr:hypothetical protein [Lagierella sp.]
MGKKAREEIKKLESMKATVEADIATLELHQKNLKQEIGAKKMQLNTLNQKIRTISKNHGSLTVSEHAIIRYMERVLGIDIEGLTEKILPEENALFIKNFGNGQYPINNGEFRIVVKDGVVVTVIGDENFDE